MSAITIIGLGAGDPGHLTREAWAILEAADEVWLRTRRHPTVSWLPSHLALYDFDNLYDEADDLQQVYADIAEGIVRLGQRPQGVIYAVPGHPLVGEFTVGLILSSASTAGLPVHVVEGVSFVGPSLTALSKDALSGLQIYDALAVAASCHPLINPDMPALLGQLHSRLLASEVKLTLMNQYPDEHEVALVQAAGTSEQSIVYMPLHQIDRHDELDHLASLYVPALAGVTSLEGLQDTVARLRSPGGCPWDREQTHQSLRASLLEEAYEVVTALDAGDAGSLREELGDLLLQIVLHSQIATEETEFTMASIIDGIDSKLKRRHPHVWGEGQVDGVGEVLQRWEELKREERGEDHALLDGVPVALPALQQADTYSRRAARVGFDWIRPDDVAEKVREEITEVKAADTPAETEAEIGDLLFAVVNWARWQGVDAETALRKANARFARRFGHMEKTVRERGEDMATLGMVELDVLWREAKSNEPHV